MAGADEVGVDALPTPFYERDGIRIFVGDNRGILPTLDPSTVSAVISDPPSGISFMNKDWDSNKGGRDQWVSWLASVLAECERAMKPGAHALVWALPRTSGWTHRAIEDAGLDIRDSIAHLFGSGFPKSLAVDKAIDKMAGAERERVRPLGTVARGTRDRTNALGGSWQDDPWETAPATPAAEQWQGWGTALKPGHEIWYLARKPLSGTVAANVLAHGTGAINIDASRIGTEVRVDTARRAQGPYTSDRTWSTSVTPARDEPKSYTGRWPANVILDEAAAEGAGEWSRYFYTPKASRRERNAGLDGMPERVSREWRTGNAPPNVQHRVPDKVSQNHHPTVKPLALMRYLITLVTPPGGIVLDPFCGSGSTLVAAAELGFPAIGIELDETYAEIAARRVDHALNQRAGRLPLEMVAD